MTCNDGKCVNRGEKTTFVYTIVGYERFKATTVNLGGEILKYIKRDPGTSCIRPINTDLGNTQIIILKSPWREIKMDNSY